MMELKDTVKGMTSDDWRVRMEAEYAQLLIRIVKLKKAILNDVADDMTSFKLMCEQLEAMRKYRRALSMRLAAVGVDVLEIEEDVFH